MAYRECKIIYHRISYHCIEMSFDLHNCLCFGSCSILIPLQQINNLVYNAPPPPCYYYMLLQSIQVNHFVFYLYNMQWLISDMTCILHHFHECKKSKIMPLKGQQVKPHNGVTQFVTSNNIPRCNTTKQYCTF